MKHLITLAAVAALLTVSACKKADKTEEPATQQEATEQVTEAAAQVTEAAQTIVATPVEEAKAE